MLVLNHSVEHLCSILWNLQPSENFYNNYNFYNNWTRKNKIQKINTIIKYNSKKCNKYNLYNNQKKIMCHNISNNY